MRFWFVESPPAIVLHKSWTIRQRTARIFFWDNVKMSGYFMKCTQVRLCTATGQWALHIRSYVICFHTKACWHGIRCGGTYCLWNHHNKLGRMVASPGDLASILHYNNPVLQEPHVAWWPGTAPGLAPGCRGSHNTHRCLFYNLSFQLNIYS